MVAYFLLLIKLLNMGIDKINNKSLSRSRWGVLLDYVIVVLNTRFLGLSIILF